MDELKEAREYEVAFLVRDEEAAERVVSRVGQYGVVITRGALKRLAFAYPVKKETSGYFGFIRLRTLPETVQRLEKDFIIFEPVLRLLVIRLSEEKTDETSHAQKMKKVVRPISRTEAAPVGVLTNEALEKKIEEILQ